MNYFNKAVSFFKWFNNFNFVIKWNVCVVVYALYAFAFGGSTILDTLMIVLLGNLYVVPAYVVIARQMNVRSDLLILVASIFLLLGYFTSLYIVVVVWIGAMAFLFRCEINKFLQTIKKQRG